MPAAATSRFSDWLDTCWQRAVELGSGYTSESQCKTIQGPRSLGDVPLADGIDAMTSSPEMESACRWTAMFAMDTLPKKLRKLVLDRLLERDPFSAAAVLQCSPALDADEEAVLRAAVQRDFPQSFGRITAAGAVKRGGVRG